VDCRAISGDVDDRGLCLRRSEAAKALLLVRTFAAVGEEFSYRGYLLTRAADLGNRTPLA